MALALFLTWLAAAPASSMAPVRAIVGVKGQIYREPRLLGDDIEAAYLNLQTYS